MSDTAHLLRRLVEAVDHESTMRVRKGEAYKAYGKGGLPRHTLGAATQEHSAAKERLDNALIDARRALR